jgi:DNA mismatch endonuclease, patch repair protein
MQGNRGRDTGPELALRSAVHAMGLRYRISAQPIAGLRRTVDLLFVGARVAVFVDGCFWHGCPEHFKPPRTNPDYWRAKITRNRDRDTDTDRRFASAGWLVVRVWEHEHPARTAERIAALVRSRQRGHGPLPGA